MYTGTALLKRRTPADSGERTGPLPFPLLSDGPPHILVNTAVANLATSFLWFGLTFRIYAETRNVIASGAVGADRTDAGVVLNGTLVGCLVGDGYDGAMTTFTLGDFNDAAAADVTPEPEIVVGSAAPAVSVADPRLFTSVDALVDAVPAPTSKEHRHEPVHALPQHHHRSARPGPAGRDRPAGGDRQGSGRHR